MKLRIVTTEFWKTIFDFKKPSLKDSQKLPERKHMSQEPIPTIQPSGAKSFQPEESQDTKKQEFLGQGSAGEIKEKPTKSQTRKKAEILTVRSELNLEQNAVFTVSTYRGKSREITVREVAPTGEVTERKAIIGKTAGGVETGVLTTHHFKVYLTLVELWEKAGKPIQEPVHFTTLRVMKRLGMKDSGEEYRHLKRWLRDLRQVPITFINSFYIPNTAEHTDLADVTILNHLHVYERKNIGKQKKVRGYGEFQFDRHILTCLINNHTHPLRLDVIKAFKKHKDLAILLYTYLDRNLAFKGKYEIGLEKLFNHLDLSQDYIPYPAKRKHRIEPVLEQLRGKPLSTGTLSYCRIHKTKEGKDYKLVCHKKDSKKLEEKEAPPQLTSQPEPESKEPKSGLLSSLIQRGLTQKQAERFISEKGPEVVKAQLDYLPFRLEEYKAQGKEINEINEAAMLYDSIRDSWNPPKAYFEAEKEKEKKKEKEAKLQALEEEYQERVKQAKAEAEEWIAKSPEDRIKASFDAWLWAEKNLSHREPTEGEIEAKRRELISGLRTKQEYERLLIHEVERDIQGKEGRI